MRAPEWPLLLLSGLISALVVFVLGVYREWRRAVRERRGLVRLVHAEIKRNHSILSKFKSPYTDSFNVYVINVHLRHVRTDDWDRSKVRLAQLIAKSERFAALNDYYDRLAYLVRLGQEGLAGPQYLKPGLDRVQECKQLGDKAIESTATLVRPWWRRWFDAE
jgi:hypothetical protein